MVEERVYVIPLRDAWNSAYHKRAKKAMRIIKEFTMKHMKVEKVKISTQVNHKIWERGNAHPPRKIKVVIKKEDKEALVDLFVDKDNKVEDEERQLQDEHHEEQEVLGKEKGSKEQKQKEKENKGNSEKEEDKKDMIEKNEEGNKE